MPSRAKSLPVSVLPMPIEPVSPIINGFRRGVSDTRKRLHEFFAQIWRDLRRYAKPGGKSGRRLMHQHAQPVEGAVTASTRSFEQWRFQRIVNDIGNSSPRRKPIQLE